MPLRETEAIVLRTYRLGDNDKIVSLFSRQLGRVRAIASGAQHPRSRFGGALEPLTIVQLWLFERENRDLLRIRSIELIESFFTAQADYAVHLAGQYVVEASDRLLPEREVNERAFRLLRAVLRGLKAAAPRPPAASDAGEPPRMPARPVGRVAVEVQAADATFEAIDRPLAYFNYWLLKLGGFLPRLDRCAVCGAAFGSGPAYYGGGMLRLVCARCRSRAERQTAPPEALVLAESMRRLPLEKWMTEPSRGARAVRLLFEEWVESAAEKHLVTRDLLDQP